MKVALLTREYPPNVYGGAGVHVEYLARELARSAEVTVHCWGEDRPPVAGGPTVVAHRPWQALAGPEPYAAALEAFSIDLTMAAGAAGAELVHSHTWYANLGGHLAKLVHGIPHVATVHSLEPMRPWKQEQLGGGYALSSFAERTALEAADAIVAVSAAHLAEILTCYPAVDPARTSVIYNGIDAEEYSPGSRHRRARAPRDRPGPPVGRVRRPDHAPEGARAPARGCAGDRSGRAARALRRSAGHAGDRPRDRGPDGGGAAVARQRDLDRGDAAETGCDPDPQPCDRVRLPVGLRADGDRQSRSDGVRGCRGRDGGRRYPRGRRGRRHRVCSSPTRRSRTERERRPTRPPSPPGSRRGSTSSWPTPRAPRRWASPAGRARRALRLGRRGGGDAPPLRTTARG